MKPESLATKLFNALASLRLAVLVMSSLALACLTATIYESKHGTAAAQREFYRTGWFAFILALLGVNIFCAMMKRYPWKSHHAGFVLAHIGILTLLTGSLLSLHFGLDSNMALYEGETSDRVALLEKVVHVALPGSVYGIWSEDFEKRPPAPGSERRFRVPGSAATLVAEDFVAHARVTETFRDGSQPNPALHLLLDNPFAKEEVWLLARDPERRQLTLGAASFALFSADSPAAAAEALKNAPAGQNRLAFVIQPGPKLTYALTTKDGHTTTGDVVVGRPLETPWMGMKVTADQALERAAGERRIEPGPPPDKDEQRMPAIKVHLEDAAGRSASEWVLWTERQRIPFQGGTALVAYQSPDMVVPFRVTLLRFNSDKYPGSNMPATYESWVRVDDPERGVSEHHISMNHPLHYRGYIFFQASFVDGQPMMSIFSVARAPGLPLVYAGVILIAAGVAWMFYLKPYLARRQAARALLAHQERSNAQSADRVVAAGPAEPASSRV